MDAAVSEVDFLEVVQIPVSEHVLVDPQQVVEGEIEHLGAGLQGRDLGEGGVEALHRLLPSFPLADAALGAVAIGRGVLKNKKEFIMHDQITIDRQTYFFFLFFCNTYFLYFALNT